MLIGVRNGWTIYYYPAFADLVDALTDDVSRLRPSTAAGHPKAKLLHRILAIALEEVPRDPGAPQYRLGNTIGAGRGHWRRAKFMERFRLFFWYHSKAKAIVYAWVNDESTMRKAGAKTDPYAIFEGRLSRGDPPDDWAELLRASQ